MDPYLLLGVGPDADEREIKRAYAKKLKQTRPDEDPKGFQQLNEAYQACLLGQTDEDDLGLSFPLAEIGTTASEIGAISEGDLFDTAAFLDDLHVQASRLSATQLSHWLYNQPALYSLSRKTGLVPNVVASLHEMSPLPPRQLQVILEFFGIHQVGHAFPWLAGTMEQLRHNSNMAHPGLQELTFRSSALRQADDSPDNSWMWRAAFWLIFIGIALARVFSQ